MVTRTRNPRTRYYCIRELSIMGACLLLIVIPPYFTSDNPTATVLYEYCTVYKSIVQVSDVVSYRTRVLWHITHIAIDSMDIQISLDKLIPVLVLYWQYRIL